MSTTPATGGGIAPARAGPTSHHVASGEAPGAPQGVASVRSIDLRSTSDADGLDFTVFGFGFLAVALTLGVLAFRVMTSFRRNAAAAARRVAARVPPAPASEAPVPFIA